MTNSIVLIQASVVQAPAPSTLQSTGALISQGGTTLAVNTYSLLTQDSDLTPLLASSLPLTSLVWSGGTVVATTAAAIPGRVSGDVFTTTIGNATPTGYNGTYRVTVTGANTFTYALASNPGSETAPGTYTPPGQNELLSQVDTFYSQGSSQSVYVLELGAGDATTGPAALGAFIEANAQFFYSYLVPRGWNGSAGLLALAAQFEAPTSKTYFFVTTTTGTYTAYPQTLKCIVPLVEAPNLPLTEFSLAADFQHTLSYAPSSVNRMTPNAFAYLYDVTPYPTVGNAALLSTLQTANISYVGTGAEGGISTAIMYRGRTLDGNDFSWWYSADWIQINCDLATANAVITGNNNSINPLYYNQNGINQLQDVAVAQVTNAISYGLANGTVTRTTLDPQTFQNNIDNGVYAGQCVVNAVPFATYLTANPDNYGKGIYGGLSVIYIPQNGFQQIIFNILITNLIGSL